MLSVCGTPVRIPVGSEGCKVFRHGDLPPFPETAIFKGRLKQPGACDGPGFENLDGCFRATGDGKTRNQPSRCDPAGTAPGADYGKGCGRNYTTCVGGLEDGDVCDGPGDCSGFSI